MPIDLETLGDFDRALWLAAADAAPPDSLREAVVNAFVGERHEQLTVWTIIAEGDPIARLARLGLGAVDSYARAGTVGLALVDDRAGPFVVGIWPTAERGVFTVVGTVPVTDDRWRRVERWVGHAAPQVVGFFLNEADFDGIGAALSEHGRVEVSRLAARVLADGSSYSRGWPESPHRARPTYRQAVAEIEGIASIRTLTMHVDNRLSMHLRRHAGATYYGGDFRLFEDAVLRALVDAAARRLRLLSGRERRSADVAETAIAVTVSSGVFADPNRIAELLDGLAEQRGTGIAVLHRNPYLHVAVTDYLDGSNADLFVTSDDRVVIYPGYRATVGALTRLTEHLADQLAAREVGDVPAGSPPTVEELFTTG